MLFLQAWRVIVGSKNDLSSSISHEELFSIRLNVNDSIQFHIPEHNITQPQPFLSYGS